MKQDIEISAADGTAKASIFRSDISAEVAEAAPGVILYMDAMGPRDSLYGMAQQLADAGYIVLLPDLFYRFGAYGPFSGNSFSNEAHRAEILKMLHGTSQEMTKNDTAAFLDVLASAGAQGPVGTVGYCMGGARALTALASYPDRVASAASFHGGNLASDAEDSPHRLADKMRGRVYIGVAGVDNSFPPEQSTRLEEALRTSGVDHVIENYVGMAHGWTVPDHGVYNEAGADRHWKRLLTFFDETLN
ncbi:dienelactone hydrolase family protein [Neorhizobium sp. P12A]|uniref:dienelactone hydrolase family protein n=1 Tax=Neorhizobium sp. P12A TaxID=2268027 RepID=UPI0011EDA20B|nr:dienelactone hydrolase family protein [Neorhizobium sp. P12A]KAA0691472.1 dienelactone hydrolase family protein [Neorhizobium sp. P12A]